MIKKKLKFDVSEMIDKFSFDTFFKEKQLGESNSGYFLITDSQTILGYNREYGKGSHSEAFANVYCLIQDDDSELEFGDVVDIDMKMSYLYIKGQLVNEKKYGTYIIFNLTYLGGITLNQFKLFEDFYNEYNDDILRISNELGEPIVHLIFPGLVTRKENDLTYLLNYFRSIIDDDKYLPSDKVIVGTILNSNKKEKK